MLLATLACSQPEPQRWNVLLVSFDTTRADHVGCYGNDEVATPVIDQLATEGVRFARAYSPIPLTTPSHATRGAREVPRITSLTKFCRHGEAHPEVRW